MIDAGRNVQHVYPTFGRAHVTDGVDCWCGPDVSVACSQCDEEPDCWKCGGEGWVEATPEDIAGTSPLIVIHYPLPEGVTLKDR